MCCKKIFRNFLEPMGTVLVAVGTVLEATKTVLVAVGLMANGVAPSVKANPRMLVGSSGRGLEAAASEALGASVGRGGSLGNVDMVEAGISRVELASLVLEG